MVSNDDFDGKATNLNCFYIHINFEQKYPKPAIVPSKQVPQFRRQFELFKHSICIPLTQALWPVWGNFVQN